MYMGSMKEIHVLRIQGCLLTTRGDLWNMIWQEGTLLIVMTTKEMERGTTYKIYPPHPAPSSFRCSFSLNLSCNFNLSVYIK